MSISRLIVLGVTHRRKVAYGYNVISDLKDWEADEWTDVKIGSIYHAITKMCEEGLLVSEGKEDSSMGPGRDKYSMTAEGYETFQALIKEALSSPDLQELAAGIAFMSNLNRSDAIEVITINQQIQQSILDKINSVEVSGDSIDEPFTNPELVNIWRGFHQTNVESIEALLFNLKSGKYKFKDD